jgi:hypothetical protein
MNKRQLTATTVRIILSASLLVITGIGVTIFSLAHSNLQQVATDVSHVVVDSDASQNNLTTLETVKKTLAINQDVITRASDIVADSQSYQYQDQIVTDIGGYANRAGIGITNIDFSAAKAAAPSSPTAATPAAPLGVKTTSVSVTLKNPVDYNSLLRFIESIEQNLTKMQISKVSLSRSTAGNEITSDILTIEVYIR